MDLTFLLYDYQKGWRRVTRTTCKRRHVWTSSKLIVFRFFNLPSNHFSPTLFDLSKVQRTWDPDIFAHRYKIYNINSYVDKPLKFKKSEINIIANNLLVVRCAHKALMASSRSFRSEGHHKIVAWINKLLLIWKWLWQWLKIFEPISGPHFLHRLTQII